MVWVGRGVWAGLVAVVLLAGVVEVGRARAALPSNCSQKGGVVTCSFSFTNFPDQTFEVPAGISSVGIVAVGAPGGPTGPRFPSPTPGGAGAVASGTVRVTGGQTLYVEVGGAGDAGFTDSAGGFNGGGMGDTAPGCGCPASGGGGGASDVRSAPYSAGLDPDPRLVVAGGGGGAGAPANPRRFGAVPGAQPGNRVPRALRSARSARGEAVCRARPVFTPTAAPAAGAVTSVEAWVAVAGAAAAGALPLMAAAVERAAAACTAAARVARAPATRAPARLPRVAAAAGAPRWCPLAGLCSQTRPARRRR